jgi:large subunit ribosomal protein L9
VKVILNKKVETLGEVGKVVEVADGYARNYLIPRGLAIEATAKNLKLFQQRQKVELARRAKKKGEAEDLAQKIEALSLTIAAKSGDKERLFGSITSQDIVRALENEGLKIERKKVLLESPIKTLGIYTIPIKLHPEVTADLKLWVVKE